MKLAEIIVLLFTLIASAFAQSPNSTPMERILTVDVSNGSKQSGVISYLSNAKEPTVLIAIIPGNPVLARATVNYFTNMVVIQQDGSFVVRERLRLLDQDIATFLASRIKA